MSRRPLSAASCLATASLALWLGGCSEPGPVKEATSAAARSGAPSAGAGTQGTTAAPEQPGSPPTKAPMNTATFEIKLTVTAGPALTAVLHNASSSPHAVVLDSSLQPTELVLTGPNGAVKPFDSRTVQKFDNTVHEGSFTAIAPGADEQLDSAKVQGGGGSATLSWGPFQFESLAAGTYKAKVVLKSVKDEYLDDGGKRVKKTDAWTGTVTSNEVTFQMP